MSRPDVSEILSTVASIALWLGLVVGLPVGLSIQANNKVTCSQQTIPYTTTTISDSSMYTYQSKTTTYGTNGTKEVCTKHNGEEVVSTKIVAQPVNQVISKGTKTFTYNAPTYSYRVGAICGDGSRSYATGRGACSWHGGVSRWLYSQ